MNEVRTRPVPGIRLTAQLDFVLRRAVSFLGQAQLPHGEFATLAGEKPDLGNGKFDSSPFVTTFVVYALQHVEGIDVEPLLERALTFLQEEAEVGGFWRYYSSRNYKHCRVPPDLDDTACASFVLRQAGRKVPRNEWAFEYLQDSNGRFLTWFVPTSYKRPGIWVSLRRAIGDFQARCSQLPSVQPELVRDPTPQGAAFDAVPCDDVDLVVNANVILFLGERDMTKGAVDDLIRRVPEVQDGTFSLYYRNKLALFYMVARAFRHSAPSLGILRTAILSDLHARGNSGHLFQSALSAAMAASILITFKDEGKLLDAAINTILRTQNADGSWQAQSLYSGPSMHWGSRELTTAFCIEALARYREMDPGCLQPSASDAAEDPQDLSEALMGPDGVDEAWYLTRYPEAACYVSAAAHYADFGWREGKDPNPNFFTAGYLRANPDVAAAETNPLVHYLTQGRQEGRSPGEPEASWNPAGVLTGAEGVDAEWYFGRYPDAAHYRSAAAHYAHHGWREGKDPNRNFSTRGYLEANPDVASVAMDPLAHFLTQGRQEGRAAVSREAQWNPYGVLTGPGGVDPEWYLARYPEARSEQSPAAHYARTGWRENKDPNPSFSTRMYLDANPDVAAAGMNPLVHYLTQGRTEGRRPVESDAMWNPNGVLTGPDGVDEDWYSARYRQAAEYGSAAAHYAQVGWRDGKDPNPSFSTTGYLRANPELAAAGVNPLVHYLSSGRAEGRTPVAPLYNVVRAADWWPSKIAPALAIAFATALQLNASLTELAWPLLTLAVGLAACAAYVSIINDLTDAEQDASSDKQNMLRGRSCTLVCVLLASTVMMGLCCCLLWRRDYVSVGLYVASWISFSLYSLSPLRLKERGLAGTLADSAGAHLFPGLLAVTLISNVQAAALDLLWFSLVGIWSFCYGLRSIIAHQLVDERYDAAAQISTYVRNVGRLRAVLVSELFLFPLEIVAFALILLETGSGVALFSLVLYGLVAYARGSDPNVHGSFAALNPFYYLIFPCSLVAASIIAHPADVLFAAGFLLLLFKPFGKGLRQTYRQIKSAHFPDHPTYRLR